MLSRLDEHEFKIDNHSNRLSVLERVAANDRSGSIEKEINKRLDAQCKMLDENLSAVEKLDEKVESRTENGLKRYSEANEEIKTLKSQVKKLFALNDELVKKLNELEKPVLPLTPKVAEFKFNEVASVKVTEVKTSEYGIVCPTCSDTFYKHKIYRMEGRDADFNSGVILQNGVPIPVFQAKCRVCSTKLTIKKEV